MHLDVIEQLNLVSPVW
uniref:Uncharacterized protein n=1 Tax=Anguilla anguilla TaxID=7936 RepID=A0A0E9TFM0_ANGAN